MREAGVQTYGHARPHDGEWRQAQCEHRDEQEGLLDQGFDNMGSVRRELIERSLRVVQGVETPEQTDLVTEKVTAI